VDVSVIIVSFNVRYFLESCLYSVFESLKETAGGEVIVVDNNSVDGTVRMLEEKFPAVRLIRNDDNKGFAKACNQGIAVAGGRYVLLLNPDTLIEEHTLSKAVRFMDDHPEAGSLGVKMIDGKGNFLPESKRALPTPMVAFYKIFGLAALFPRSKKFNRYYMGHIGEDETHPVEVLTGAFMLIRTDLLRKIGGLDEEYFMYGEDIDLSYRILKEGYKNYYFPETTIIHYKGESTKKGSLNYVLLFYKAMLIFAGKHFSPRQAGVIGMLIRPAIYLRAALSALKRVMLQFFYPVTDALLLYGGYFFLVPAWEKIRFHSEYYYPPLFMRYVIPAYVLVWIISVWLSGGYRRPVRPGRVIRGLVLGTVVILVVYALLPMDLRFSRVLIIAGMIWGILSTAGIRWLLGFLPGDVFELAGRRKKKILVVSGPKEFDRIAGFLKQVDVNVAIAGYVTPPGEEKTADALGDPAQLPEIVKVHDVREIIFSAVDNRSAQIIRTMNRLAGVPVEFKVALPEGSPIVGSNSVERPGELYFVELSALSQSNNKRRKRAFDIFFSLVFLILLPVMLVIVRKRKSFLKNIFLVLKGEKTWIGYCPVAGETEKELPHLPPGVLCPASLLSSPAPEEEVCRNMNHTYARNYHLSLDVRILFRSLKKLGDS
jgi:GT2 family glycosyltransferase